MVDTGQVLVTPVGHTIMRAQQVPQLIQIYRQVGPVLAAVAMFMFVTTIGTIRMVLSRTSTAIIGVAPDPAALVSQATAIIRPVEATTSNLRPLPRRQHRPPCGGAVA